MPALYKRRVEHVQPEKLLYSEVEMVLLQNYGPFTWENRRPVGEQRACAGRDSPHGVPDIANQPCCGPHQRLASAETLRAQTWQRCVLRTGLLILNQCYKK